jgi:hypothetical protein
MLTVTIIVCKLLAFDGTLGYLNLRNDNDDFSVTEKCVNVRFEVLLRVNFKITEFRDVVPCS